MLSLQEREGKDWNATITSCSTRAGSTNHSHTDCHRSRIKLKPSYLHLPFQRPANALFMCCPGYSLPCSLGGKIITTTNSQTHLATFQKLVVWNLVSMGKHVPDSSSTKLPEAQESWVSQWCSGGQQMWLPKTTQCTLTHRDNCVSSGSVMRSWNTSLVTPVSYLRSSFWEPIWGKQIAYQNMGGRIPRKFIFKIFL